MGTPIAPRTPEEIAAHRTGLLRRRCRHRAQPHRHRRRRGRRWPPATARVGIRCWPNGPTRSLYPTINGVGDHETRFCHIAPLAESGELRIGLIDPGSVNLGSLLHLRERRRHPSSTSGRCVEQYELGPTMAIFEPGFLRATLSMWRAGTLPAGAMIRFYFGGTAREASGDYWFGLPPTEASLEAYLAMLDGCPIPVVGSGARRRPLRLRPSALRARARRSSPGRPRGLRTVTRRRRTSSSSRRPSTRCCRARVSSSRRAPKPRRCWDCGPPVAAGVPR